jgi:predicted amidohydrolase YtcJ
VSLAEALTAYTAGAARAAGEEGRKGRLEPEQTADLVVWSEDLFAMVPADLHRARAALTVLGGEVVHENVGAPAAAR